MSTLKDLPVSDLSTPLLLDDPFDHFAMLRREAPVSRVKAPLIRGTGYLLTRYDDVLTLHTDARFSSDMMANTSSLLTKFMPRMFKVLVDTMVFKDDPEHKRVRGLVHKAFTPKRVQGMASEIERTVDRLVDQLASRSGPVDLIAELAVPLPLSIIASMLGVDPADRDEFHHNVTRLTTGFNEGLSGILRSLPANRRMLRLFDRLTEQRRTDPDEHLITALVEACDEEDRLSHDEVVAMIFLLLLAGHDTTANIIGSGILTLLEHPDQLERLRAEPELIDSAIEELLRFNSPVTCGAPRQLTEEVELRGITMPKGSQVLGMIISANRDEDVFDRPDDLDLARQPNRHLAFAFGSHFCLGNQLARHEAKTAINAIVQRFPDLALAVPRDAIKWKPTPSLRGPVAVPLVTKARATAA